LIFAAVKGQKDVARVLLKNSADVNANDKYGRTALMMASCNGYKDVVELLIEKGADVNAKDYKGFTVMFLACDDEMRKTIIEIVKKRNEKTNENVVTKGIER
jgi:ankyrin repeat protein